MIHIPVLASPEMIARCMGEQRIKVLMSEVVEGSGSPGEILGDATIACQSGALKLTRLQRAGKGAMDIKNFLLGYNFPNKKLN